METTWTISEELRLKELASILFAEDILKVFSKEEEDTPIYKEYASLLTKKQIHLMNNYNTRHYG